LRLVSLLCLSPHFAWFVSFFNHKSRIIIGIGVFFSVGAFLTPLSLQHDSAVMTVPDDHSTFNENFTPLGMCVSAPALFLYVGVGLGLIQSFQYTTENCLAFRNLVFLLYYRKIYRDIRLIRHHRHNRHHTHTHTHTHTKEKLIIKRSINNSHCIIKKLKMPTITFVVTRVLLISLLQGIVVEGLAASKNSGSPPPARLKQLLQSEMDGTRESDKPILLPCCYDGLTARLVARAGFDATFMTGFGVSAVNGTKNGYNIIQ
jgi:hypothetical protein